MYYLDKEEKAELEKLERKLTYSNGIIKKDEAQANPVDAIRLKMLYEKKQELLQASLN